MGCKQPTFDWPLSGGQERFLNAMFDEHFMMLNGHDLWRKSIPNFEWAMYVGYDTTYVQVHE